MTDPVVRAAGGVVWRLTDAGDVEVVVVHRPAPRSDWSLPKGKLEPGEHHRDAALREVHEETGLRCDLGAKLADIRYPTPAGEKRVRWWEMTALGDDGFEPNPEIDERRWVTLADADELVTWDTDRLVLRAFTERLVVED